MNAGLNEQKAALRRTIRAVLKNFPAEKRAADSPKVCGLLQRQPFWRRAAAVLLIAPLPDEVDVWPLAETALAGGKIITLPRFDPVGAKYAACRVKNLRNEIVPGQFDIREPASGCAEIPLNELDLALVPGVAFDLQGRRLGRGSGFYDRLLGGFSGVKCGIAFDEQLVDEVPTAPSDVRMDFILTPTRCEKVAE
jgi:5-formyltetrahydrofolate cyclo-ligase